MSAPGIIGPRISPFPRTEGGLPGVHAKPIPLNEAERLSLQSEPRDDQKIFKKLATDYNFRALLHEGLQSKDADARGLAAVYLAGSGDTRPDVLAALEHSLSCARNPESDWARNSASLIPMGLKLSGQKVSPELEKALVTVARESSLAEVVRLVGGRDGLQPRGPLAEYLADLTFDLSRTHVPQQGPDGTEMMLPLGNGASNTVRGAVSDALRTGGGRSIPEIRTRALKAWLLENNQPARDFILGLNANGSRYGSDLTKADAPLARELLTRILKPIGTPRGSPPRPTSWDDVRLADVDAVDRLCEAVARDPKQAKILLESLSSSGNPAVEPELAQLKANLVEMARQQRRNAELAAAARTP